jgi:hypothetical protein
VNFGTIINSVTKSCVSMVVESNHSESKSMARDFIRYVQLKEVLEKQFRVYHQLNSSYIEDKDSAKLFVSETLNILESFDFNDILSYNHILESKFKVPRMKSTDVNLAISKIIRHKTSINKPDTMGYIDALAEVVDHVNTFREEQSILESLDTAMATANIKFLQPKHVVRIALNKFNDRYTSKFDEGDRTVFNTLREGDSEKIESLYSTTYGELLREFDAFEVGKDRDLADKLNEVFIQVGNGCTQENLLDAHELCSELKRLREES